LERKVFIKAFKRLLYPNLYVLLVGGPGVGKTDAIRGAFEFWDTIPQIHQAPSNVSRASLVDSLAKAERALLLPNELIKFNHLNVASDELGVFLSQYESSFMSTLNKLYDGTIYTEEKRSMKNDIKIEKPLLNLIAGTTPAWLGGNLPETAWAEGFSSRLLLVYSGERIKIDPFAGDARDAILFDKLQGDFKTIHNLIGKLEWAPDVVEAFKAWYMLDCPPIPDHPKLEHYLPRRHIHFLKLCIIQSVSRSNDLVIRMVDYQAAMEMLLITEGTMPDVFRSMRMINSDANVIDEAFNYIYTLFAKEQKPISEHRLIHFLSQRMPSHSVFKVIETMVASNMIEVGGVGTGLGGRNSYRPVPKISHGK
jgi:DNA replicative helicase MCM subunit Mcm2 (Cdc46/Mcm family)